MSAFHTKISTPTTERVEGNIERVTFSSEETGFCVLRVKAREHRDLVTVVGTLPQVNAGEWVKAEGQWVMDPKHGRQLKASSMELSRPDSLAGIEKYLGPGLVKGIGPTYARKMVEKFGQEVFEVIEDRSKMLERIAGIGPTRRRLIKEAWNEQKVVREIMTFLLSHGVGTTRAFRIYKAYGESAVQTVRTDPYTLARDIRGIGFKTADQIAGSIGIEKTSNLRARAGVGYVLQELTLEGHCAHPRTALVEKAREILEIPEAIVADAVSHELTEKRLVREQSTEHGELIYLAAIHHAERRLANCVAELGRGAHPSSDFDLSKALAWVQEKTGVELSDAQRQAFKTALTSKTMIITGGPGVGKTTLVNSIVKVLHTREMRVVLSAPTGRAAKRMSEASDCAASTIHRLLKYDPRVGRFKHDESYPLVGDVFIVDEASMLDVILAHQLVRAIPKRASLILVGDVDQLPSVGPGTVLRDLIQSGAVPVIELDRIFRQAAESLIVTNAHAINQGHVPVYPENKEDSDFYFAEADEPEKAVRMIQKLISDSIPNRFGLNACRDIMVLTPMQRGELGVRNLNVVLQKTLNPKGDAIERFGQIYRVGDRVMQMENDYDKEVFNGDLGWITELEIEDQELRIRFDERDVRYDFRELDEVGLAYATTIHKSQGSEYPCCIIPIHTQHYVMLQRNLLYTAVTRARKLVVLVGSRKALEIAVQRASAVERITTLRERMVELGTSP